MFRAPQGAHIAVSRVPTVGHQCRYWLLVPVISNSVGGWYRLSVSVLEVGISRPCRLSVTVLVVGIGSRYQCWKSVLAGRVSVKCTITGWNTHGFNGVWKTIELNVVWCLYYYHRITTIWLLLDTNYFLFGPETNAFRTMSTIIHSVAGTCRKL